MAAMMRGMRAQPTGDIDRDFVQQMIPHHQRAIDVAKALLQGHWASQDSVGTSASSSGSFEFLRTYAA